MTPERWQIVTSVFEHCHELPPEDRTAFLRLQDVDVASEVARLLEESSNCPADFLMPVASLTDPPSVDRPMFNPGDIAGGQFVIDQFLGRGGMAEVYRSGSLAIKVIRLGRPGIPKLAARLHRELMTAKRVSHRNVCRVLELHEHQLESSVVPFLTMEFIEGITLFEALKRRRSFAIQEADPLVEDMLAGLSAAHAVGVIHRDLKPSNVMLRPGGDRVEAVLMDFGLALPSEQGGSITTSGHILGTLDFVSPEQLAGAPATPRSDIYALGLILYEMVTGSRPYPADTPEAAISARMQQDAPPLTIGGANGRNWSRTIRACLERDPAARPASAEIVLECLRGKRNPSPLFERFFRAR